MNEDRFGRWCFSHVLRGQYELAETVRMLVYKTDPDAFEQLEFDNDSYFLNPLLFAWFTASKTAVSLHQALMEYAAPRPRLQNSTIEIFACAHPLVERFFVDASGEATLPEIDKVAAAHATHLNKAFRLLQTHCKGLALAIATCTRSVMLYRAPAPNSFAALSAHGMVFFNVPDRADEVFFLEDIAHQCTHVLFNAMTFDKRRYLAVDPSTALSDLFGDSGETRTVYTVFHALSTYTVICRVLSAMLERKVFTGRREHELKGRLAFTLKKFSWDLPQLDEPGLFTTRGRLVYRRFAALHAHYMARDGELTQRLDLSGQPYNFSYASFATRNPLPLEEPAEA